MNIIQLCAQRAGLSTRAYTGRGMYGSKCLGIDCPSLASFLKQTMRQINSEEELNEYADSIGGYITDSMGMGVIVYFPSISYEEEEYEEEEYEEEEYEEVDEE